MTQAFENHNITVKFSQKTKNYTALIETVQGRFIMKSVDSPLTTLEENVRKSGHLPDHVIFKLGTSNFVVNGKELGKECAIVITRKKRKNKKLQICIITKDNQILADFPASSFTKAKEKIYKAGKKIYEPGIVSNSIVINKHNPTYFHLPLNFPFEDFIEAEAENETSKETLKTAVITVTDTSKKAARNSRKALKNGKRATKEKVTAKIEISGKKTKIFTANDLAGIKRAIKDAGQIPGKFLTKIILGECTFEF